MVKKNAVQLKIRLALLLMIAPLLFSGCGGGQGGESVVQVNPDTAAQAILNEVTFRDTLVKAEDGAADSFYKLDDSVAGYAIYISGSGATAEEIAVLEVEEGYSLSDVQAILDKRVETLKRQFVDYVPEEMVKLEDPVIVAKGNVAILVLADDSAAAKKAVDGVFQ